MPDQELRFHFGAQDRAGLMFGLRGGQLSLAASGIVLSLVALIAGRGPAGIAAAAVVLAVTAAGTLMPVAGRGMDEWIPVLTHWFAGPGHTWRSAGSRTGQVVSLRPTSSGHPHVASQQPSLPATLRGVTLLAMPVASGHLGVIRDTAQGTYTAVLRVRGGSYALLAESDKARALAGWGGVLASLAHAGSPVARIQVVIRTLAEDPDAIARYLQARRAIDLDSPILRSYVALVDEASPTTQSQEAYVALAIGARQAHRAIRQAGGGDRGAVVVLARQLELVQQQLEQTGDVRVEGALTPRLLAQVLREAWDPAAAASLRRRSSAAPTSGVALSGAGPQSTRSSWTHYRTDGGACHATYWVSEWPRVPVGSNLLVPLILQSPVTLTWAVTMAPVDPARARRDIEAAQTSRLADSSLREQHGFRTSLRTSREQEAIEQREGELADGHAEYRFSGYITVTAPDEEHLAEACGAVEQQARTCQLDVRRMDGEHDRGFTHTLPLCRGVR